MFCCFRVRGTVVSRVVVVLVSCHVVPRAWHVQVVVVLQRFVELVRLDRF